MNVLNPLAAQQMLFPSLNGNQKSPFSPFANSGLMSGLGVGIQPNPKTSQAFMPPGGEKVLAQAYEKLAAKVMPENVLRQGKPTYSANDFSPDAVANRILGFVEKRLELEKLGGASESRLKDLYQQAQRGIEQGLKEARGIISGAGLFKDKVYENYTETEKKLRHGMDELGDRLFNPTHALMPRGTQTFASAMHAYESRSFNLEVKTREGDVVTLNIESSKGLGFGQSSTQGSHGIAAHFSSTYSSDLAIRYSVEGHLNEGEQKALAELFQNVDKLAKKFYNGDVEQAFNKALSMGFDSSQIAEFSLNMQHTQVRQAMTSYQTVGNLGNQFPSQVSLKPLADFATDLLQTAKQLGTSDIENPHRLLQNMLQELLPLHKDEVDSTSMTQNIAPWMEQVLMADNASKS